MKNKRNVFICNAAIGQIFLIVMFTFSVAFIISEASLVRGQNGGDTTYWWNPDAVGGDEIGVGPIPPGAVEIDEETYNIFTRQIAEATVATAGGGGAGATEGGVGINPSGTDAAARAAEEAAQKAIEEALKDQATQAALKKAGDEAAQKALEAGLDATQQEAARKAAEEAFKKALGSGGTTSGFVYTTKSPYNPYGIEGICPEFLCVGPQAHLVQGAVWALTVYFAVQFIADAFGADESLTDALSTAAAAGVFAFKFVPFAHQLSPCR